MAKQSLMWTALPNGFDQHGNLRISAMLSPRLVPDGDQNLKPFTDLVDWPKTVQSARFTIRYGAQSEGISGNELAAPARVDSTMGTSDSNAWKHFFTADTFVSGYVFENHANDVVLSYDAMAMDGLSHQLYGQMGASGGDKLPTISHYLSDPGWQEVITSVNDIDRLFTQEKEGGLRDPEKQFAWYRNHGLSLGSPVATLLARAQLFHTPPSTPQTQDYARRPLAADDPRRKMNPWRTYARTDLPKKADIAKQIDFHQIVAAMNQYPRLLRVLGLVVDFIIPAGTFTLSSDQALTVICDLSTAARPGLTRSQASSPTRTMLTKSRFAPVPRSAWNVGDYMVRDGLLVINPDLFGILQSDVDAAGLKIMNFARTLGRLSSTEKTADPVTKFEKEVGAPALRNAGLMFVHRRRALLLENAWTANKAKNDAIEQAFAANDNSKALPLYTEDLIRGWRIDIWDSVTKKWHSLCERTAHHVIDGAIVLDDECEGVVRLATTKSADDTSNQDIVYLHEALVSWTGWSLTAPQPGQAIDKDDNVGSSDMEIPPGIRLANTFKVKPGTLPRLRYGRSYWVRARMVDLAGNSLPPSEKDYGAESPDKYGVVYLRFEPVQAPSIALLREVGNVEKPAEGESMERMAIRTFNATPADNVIPSAQVARRMAVPARTDVRTGELHGMLDSGGNVNGSVPTYNMLAKRDTALEEVKLVTPGPLVDAASPPVETFYAVLDSDATEIPYLPDPLCVHLAARIFDHPTFPSTTVIDIPVYQAGKSWPGAAPFTIGIYENPAESPKFDKVNRVLMIPLPKAVRATLRLSSQLALHSLELLGMWRWTKDYGGAPLQTAALQGQHWLTTPWRNVELVHAVQKPLITPEMKFRIGRNFGETRALPVFTATCSLASTARIDLQAEWNEPESDAEPAPIGTFRFKSDHAYSVKITDPTSYAMRKYDPTATGIPEHDIVGPDLISVGADWHDTLIKHHEFHDTRYRRVEYWLDATTRFREYMPASILTKDEVGKTIETDENVKVIGPRIVAYVPNSAPPPAPEVLYVVPTFGWTTSKSGASETHWRRGGGLRVYLNRPWNVSGFGEMLAVVLPSANFNGDPNTEPKDHPLKKFVTQWGNDPVWVSPYVAGPSPKAENFPLRRTQADPSGAWLPSFVPLTEALQPAGPFLTTGRTHPGLNFSFSDPQALIDVAPHDVAYDADRHLWYCDIEVTFGWSYCPFIRLALARYQPVSVPAAYLSNIVLADFMPLAPDRWLTVTSVGDGRVRNVSVYGYHYTDSAGHVESSSAPSSILLTEAENPVDISPTSMVEVWVEQFNPALGKDFGWSRDDSSVVSPTLPGRSSPIGTVLGRALSEEALTLRRPAVASQLINPVALWPVLWNGTVTLPPGPAAKGTGYRVVVAEYEEYLVDDPTPYNKTPSVKERRLVFLEYVELS
jgi:hypothetical protein